MAVSFRAIFTGILVWVSAGPAGLGAEAAGLSFTDAGAALGIKGPVVLSGRSGKDHLLDSAGTGVALLDYDRDGRLDIYIVNGWRLEDGRVAEKGSNALWHQRADGSFENVTAPSGTAGEGRWACGAFAADYDGDGWTDILVTAFGPNVLYRNRGDGTFINVAREAGLESPGWNTGAAFFDADGDGDLDVYIAGYIECSLEEVLSAQRTLDWKGREKVAKGPFGLKGAPDHFFRQDRGKFSEATKDAGFDDRAHGFGFAVRAADFDDDGDLDVFVANDSDANYLYRNDGKGHFREMGLAAGCALNGNGSAQANMGVAVGDFNGDQILDIFSTTFAEDPSVLYLGIGGGLFDDATAASGIQRPTYVPLAWGCIASDLDSDGDLDLAMLNGHIYPQVDRHPDAGQSYTQLPQLLDNRGATFVEATASAGPPFQKRICGRGLAAGDLDNDGDIDLVGTALDSVPFVMKNEGRQGSWLVVVLEDEKGPRSYVGARVTVTAAGKKQVRDAASGDSYLSTNDPRLHFGLGAADRIDRLEVRWPDGKVLTREGDPARQFLRLRR